MSNTLLVHREELEKIIDKSLNPLEDLARLVDSRLSVEELGKRKSPDGESFPTHLIITFVMVNLLCRAERAKDKKGEKPNVAD